MKVSIKQRRGKKVVLFGSLTTFLHQLENRKTEKFVLYVTETGFKIIQKDRVVLLNNLEPSGAEQTDAPQKQTNKPLKENFRFKHANEAKINYINLLRNSFQGYKESANFTITPETVKMLPAISMETKFKYTNGAKINYMNSLRSSFKGNKQSGNFTTTPEIVRMLPAISMQTKH